MQAIKNWSRGRPGNEANPFPIFQMGPGNEATTHSGSSTYVSAMQFGNSMLTFCYQAVLQTCTHTNLSHDIEASTPYLIVFTVSSLRFKSADIWFCTKDRNRRHDKPHTTSQHKGGRGVRVVCNHSAQL